MLLRIAVTAPKNANCSEFTDLTTITTTTVIPFSIRGSTKPPLLDKNNQKNAEKEDQHKVDMVEMLD